MTCLSSCRADARLPPEPIQDLQRRAPSDFHVQGIRQASTSIRGPIRRCASLGNPIGVRIVVLRRRISPSEPHFFAFAYDNNQPHQASRHGQSEGHRSGQASRHRHVHLSQQRRYRRQQYLRAQDVIRGGAVVAWSVVWSCLRRLRQAILPVPSSGAWAIWAFAVVRPRSPAAGVPPRPDPDAPGRGALRPKPAPAPAPASASIHAAHVAVVRLARPARPCIIHRPLLRPDDVLPPGRRRGLVA